MEGIRRALVLGLVLIAGTSIEKAPSVGPLYIIFINVITKKCLSVPGYIENDCTIYTVLL